MEVKNALAKSVYYVTECSILILFEYYGCHTPTLTSTVVGEISTVELRFFGLIGRATHPVMQNIRINGFLFENRLHWQF
jgi:hypothetical protein